MCGASFSSNQRAKVKRRRLGSWTAAAVETAGNLIQDHSEIGCKPVPSGVSCKMKYESLISFPTSDIVRRRRRLAAG